MKIIKLLVLAVLFVSCTGISCHRARPVENCLLWNYYIIKKADDEKYQIVRVQEDDIGFTIEFQSAFNVPGRGGEFEVPKVWINNIRYIESPLNGNLNDLYVDWSRFYTSGASTTERLVRCVRQSNLEIMQ